MALFDRSLMGQTIGPVSVILERGPMLFFAETIGETNPVHLDPAAAHAAGHPDILALPTYAVVIASLADKSLARQGRCDSLKRLGADMRYLLHGGESYTYHAPIFAGETVEVTTEFAGVSNAGGGTLEIARIYQHIVHTDRGPLVTTKRDLIHKLPK
ncbi:FAS1-like dehydratase domain-containing protein [Shimia abyssi]|uniref:Acyl dehydratase n=1 Tax=Shimia abyssi TaxID=1662395 RepID=A0A2P8F7L5_9RHOB|nr:MaoC family dehydratase N-terminal domain-containing protein [Shimia abyssi]PSL17704.1 acyl dehydratase [Shimia abyssi]